MALPKPHDPMGASKLKEFTLSAWIKPRTHADDSELKVGERRAADTVLQLNGLRLQVAVRAGQAIILDESGIPIPIVAFLETARLEGRRIYALLIATLED